MKKDVLLPISVTTVWIAFSEFLRNELLFKDYWTDHYDSLGLAFPSEVINGAIWGVWSLLLAILIFVLAKKQTFREVVIISWVAAFLMMWLVIGNLGVLPVDLLVIAAPLSLLEVYVATWIVFKFKETKKKR